MPFHLFTHAFQERGRPSLGLKVRSCLKKRGPVIRDQHTCFQGNIDRQAFFQGVRVLVQEIQDSPQDYLFSPPALCFFPCRVLTWPWLTRWWWPTRWRQWAWRRWWPASISIHPGTRKRKPHMTQKTRLPPGSTGCVSVSYLLNLQYKKNITYCNDNKCLNLSPGYHTNFYENTLWIILIETLVVVAAHFLILFVPLNCRWMSTSKKSWLRSRKEKHRAPSLLGVPGCVAFFSFLVNSQQTVWTMRA